MRAVLVVTACATAVGMAVSVAVPVQADRMSASSPCVPVLTQSVAPSRVLLGETTSVSVRISAGCAALPRTLHAVFAIGATQSMTDQQRQDAHVAAKWQARRLLRDASGTRLGVVGQRGATACNLSEDLGVVLRCLDRAFDTEAPQTAPAPEQVLTAASTILTRARRSHPASFIDESVLLIAASPDESECPSWLSEAKAMKEHAIRIASFCAEQSCASRCLEKLATSPRYAFDLSNFSSQWLLPHRIFREVGNEIGLQSVIFEYPLPRVVGYVPDSLNPALGLYDRANHRISWRSNYLPRQGVTITFQVEPLAAGTVQMGAGSFLRASDTYRLPVAAEMAPQGLSAFGSG